jgi:hypothetical protein
MTATIHIHPSMTFRAIRRLMVEHSIKSVFGHVCKPTHQENKNVQNNKRTAFLSPRDVAQPDPAKAAQPAARGEDGNERRGDSVHRSSGGGEEMTLHRFEELRRAQRLLELAELKANRGAFGEAEVVVNQARILIFGSTQQVSPARPAGSGLSNTGSCIAESLTA